MAGKAEKIRAYLDGPRQWGEGVVLYHRYGSNQALKSIFARVGETRYNYQRLLDELRALLPAEKPQAVKATNVAERELDALAANDPRIIPLYRERQHLHAQLMVLPTDLARKQAAFRIVEITHLLDQLQAGELPLEKRNGIAAQDNASLLKKLLNNRAYISKYRNHQDKQQNVQQRIVENQRIEKHLNQ